MTENIFSGVPIQEELYIECPDCRNRNEILVINNTPDEIFDCNFCDHVSDLIRWEKIHLN